jgi:hypothetical protein
MLFNSVFVDVTSKLRSRLLVMTIDGSIWTLELPSIDKTMPVMCHDKNPDDGSNKRRRVEAASAAAATIVDVSQQAALKVSCNQ